MTKTNPNYLPTKWITPEAAAAYLGGLSKLTLAGWRTKGRGPVYHKAGGLVRYLQADLDAWMEASPRGLHKENIESQLVDIELKSESIRHERDVCYAALVEISCFTLCSGTKDIKIADKMRLIADDAIAECLK